MTTGGSEVRPERAEETDLTRRAAAAALRVRERHGRALVPSVGTKARWHTAVAKLAQAASELASLAAELNEREDLMSAGAIGDVLIGACAADAIEPLHDVLEEIESVDIAEEWESWTEAVIRGDSGERVQRFLVDLSGKLGALSLQGRVTGDREQQGRAEVPGVRRGGS